MEFWKSVDRRFNALVGNNKTEKIDSLKVLNNSFIISKDTVGTGYNQVKGLEFIFQVPRIIKYTKPMLLKKRWGYFLYARNDAQELVVSTSQFVAR